MAFNYSIEKEYGQTSGSSYPIQVNEISYNGAPSKIDIRRWNEDKMLKGLTMTRKEAAELCQLLQAVIEGYDYD